MMMKCEAYLKSIARWKRELQINAFLQINGLQEDR